MITITDPHGRVWECHDEAEMRDCLHRIRRADILGTILVRLSHVAGFCFLVAGVVAILMLILGF